MQPVPSISFVIPSMNEATNVENVVREVEIACAKLTGKIDSVELVLVNDGSSDATGEIIDRIAARLTNARCVHHPRNLGFGAAYKSGVRAATKNYIYMVPGENSVPPEAMIATLSALGKADMIIAYPLNTIVRKRVRQLLSRSFQWLTKTISSQDIRYFNGPNLYLREHVLAALPTTNGHAYQLEMILKLLSLGRTYAQVGINVRDRPSGKSKALRPKNVVRVVWTLIRVTCWAAFRQRSTKPAAAPSRQPS